MKSYNLFLKTSSQCVEIPFKDIISLDKFTSYYSDANELAEFLIRCLRLNVKVDYQTEIAVLVKNSPKNNGRYLPILYNADKVSMEELQEEFLNYLLEDLSRIKRCGIGKLNNYAIIDYVNEGKAISYSSLKFAVASYLKLGYLERREIYFLVNKKKTRENKVMISDKEYESKDFLDDLAQMYQMYPEMQEELLEEIGMYEGGNLVMEKLMKKDDLEVLRLEKCVGMDIRSIVNNLVVYTRGNSNGRNR